MPIRPVLSILLLIPSFLVVSSCTPEPPAQDRGYYDELPLDNLEAEQANMVYTVRTASPASQILNITLEFPVGSNDQPRFHGGTEGEYDILEVTLTNEAGAVIPHERDGKYIETKSDVRGLLTLNYQVQIGGIGRHGHQGYMKEGFAAFDGRIYLIPVNADHIREVQVTFDYMSLGDGLTLITPWQPTEAPNTYRLYDYGKHAYLFKSLKKSMTVIGAYERVDETIGSSQVQVYTSLEWDETFRATTTQNSLTLFRYFNETLGYEVEGPYQMVWTTGTDDGKKIWTAVWSNGMAYEMFPERPSMVNRNLELVGHRIAHPMHEYAPWGMRFKEKDEHWFLEGWASYVELRAIEETGLFDVKPRWARLYNVWQSHLAGGENQDWPLATEQDIEDSDVKEYVHYYKAPLVVWLLAQEAIEATGGQKDLEDFMRYAYGKYKGFNGDLPLRDELESFFAHDFGPFWDTYINREGTVPDVFTSM